MNTLNTLPIAKQLLMKQIKVITPNRTIPIGTYTACLRGFVIEGEYQKLTLKLHFEVVDDPLNPFIVYSDVIVGMAKDNMLELDIRTLDNAIRFIEGENPKRQHYSYKLHGDRLIHLSKLVGHECEIEITYSAHIHEDATLIKTDTQTN